MIGHRVWEATEGTIIQVRYRTLPWVAIRTWSQAQDETWVPIGVRIGGSIWNQIVAQIDSEGRR